MVRVVVAVVMITGLCFSQSAFSNEQIAYHLLPGASGNGTQSRPIVELSGATSISGQKLNEFAAVNYNNIQTWMSQGYFLNSSVSANEAVINGDTVITEKTKQCLAGRSEIGVPQTFTFGQLNEALVGLQEQGFQDECSRSIKKDFSQAAAFIVARDMKQLPTMLSERTVADDGSVIVETSFCGPGVCGPFVDRPVFPVLNLAARAALFPFRVAGRALIGAARIASLPFRAAANVIGNGIAFRQDLRATRQGLGLDVASVQSTPGFFNRVALRQERRALGLGLIPGFRQGLFGPLRFGGRFTGRFR